MKKMIAVAMIAVFAVACTNGTTNTKPSTTDTIRVGVGGGAIDTVPPVKGSVQ